MRASRRAAIYGASGKPSSVIFFLRGDALTDESQSKLPIVNTGVTTSTAQVKIGSKSLLFNGTSNFMRIASVGGIWSFGKSDWTVDWWEYRTAFTGNDRATFKFNITNDQDYGAVVAGYAAAMPNVTMRYMESPGTANSWGIQATMGVIPSGNYAIWIHWAIVHKNEMVYIYKDGVLVGSHTNTNTSLAPFAALDIGKYSWSGGAAAAWFPGHINAFRISNIARWSANFTPPTIYANGGESS